MTPKPAAVAIAVTMLSSTNRKIRPSSPITKPVSDSTTIQARVTAGT